MNALNDPFGTVTWLLGDHLGSTSLSVSESGTTIAEAKYTPVSPKGMLREGKQRNLAGDLPTDYGYTGQREESALGLMYYVARWYDSGIGHFVQADTVVPGAGNPAAYNRYAYVMYNPLRYVDPSGHLPMWCAEDPSLPGCNGYIEEDGGGELPGSGEGSLPGNADPTQTPTPPSPSSTLSPITQTPTPPTSSTPTQIPTQTPTPTPIPTTSLDERRSPFAVSIAVDISGGIGFGSIGAFGFVFKDGVHPYTEIGESSAVPGEFSIGIELELDWDTESLSDFSGDDVEVGFTVADVWGASVALSVEPGEGLWGIGRVTGISLSPEFGFGISGFWNYSIKSVID